MLAIVLDFDHNLIIRSVDIFWWTWFLLIPACFHFLSHAFLSKYLLWPLNCPRKYIFDVLDLSLLLKNYLSAFVYLRVWRKLRIFICRRAKGFLLCQFLVILRYQSLKHCLIALVRWWGRSLPLSALISLTKCHQLLRHWLLRTLDKIMWTC